MTNINIYCDEIWPTSNNNLIVLGALFVKDWEFCISALEKMRKLNPNCPIWHYKFIDCLNRSCEEYLHEGNNTKIHFNDIHRRKERRIISKSWLKLLSTELKEKVKFKILVIDLRLLDITRFGGGKNYLNIYNRFFRTLISGGINYHFRKRNIKIENIYHHKGSQQTHFFFPKENIMKLKEDHPEINISSNNVIFIEGDHKKYLDYDLNLVRESQFVQLIDLLLGSFLQLYKYPSNNKSKIETAEEARMVFKSHPFGSTSRFPRYPIYKLRSERQRGIDSIYNIISNALYDSNNFENEINFEMPNYKDQPLDKWF